MTIGERIRDARTRAGYHTGSGFARHIGIRPETLSRIECGHCDPSLTTLKLIASGAGAELSWLATGEGAAPEAA